MCVPVTSASAPAKVLDAFVNVYQEGRNPFAASAIEHEVLRMFGSQADTATFSIERLIQLMDEAGVERAIATRPLTVGDPTDLLDLCERYPERFRASFVVDDVTRIRTACALVEELAPHPMVVAMRVVPHVLREPLNAPCLYPIYERCEALSIPITINVGLPEPRRRAAGQHPLLLDEVLLDFPDLVVVGAHMGHPWERLLVRLMTKYENLYLCNSAYLAKYLDPYLVEFMNSSRGRHKVIFSSDHPVLALARAADAARQVPLCSESLDAFLRGNAMRVFGWPPAA